MKNHKQYGFTIVELLIVIVVIGILAALTLATFNGIQARGRKTAIIVELANARKQLDSDKIVDERYPSSTAVAAGGSGLTFTQGTTLQYSVDASGQYYCLNATHTGTTANINTAMPTAQLGNCTLGNRTPNPSFESDTSTAGSSSTTEFTRSDKRALDGDYALRINSNGAGSDRYVYVKFPVTPGTWTVSAGVFLESNGTTDYGRGMWVNDDPIQNATSVVYQTIVNSWQTLSTSFVIATGKSGILIRFYVMPGADIYIDNVRVTPA